GALGVHLRSRSRDRCYLSLFLGAEWTSWFNIDHPGGDGDHESLEAIKFYYRDRVCDRPVAIQARTTEWELPAAVGQVVHASPKSGFRCLHREQPPGKSCSNYHVRFLCPLGEGPGAREPLASCGHSLGSSTRLAPAPLLQLCCLGWGAEGRHSGSRGCPRPEEPPCSLTQHCELCRRRADGARLGAGFAVVGASLRRCQPPQRQAAAGVCKTLTPRREPVKVVAECGCGPCAQPRVLVQGRVTAADTGEPLRFGHIFLGGRKVGFTGYHGSFTIEVPPDTQRLVTRFVDGQQRLVDAVRVLPFDRRGGAVYQEVKMLRKKEPVELDGGRSNAIPLGEAGGREPVGELVLPAGAFLRPSGEVFNGTVKASVTFVDPRDMATASAASSDLSFANAEGEIVPLRTYGMFAVDFREGESGAALQAGPVQVRMDAGQVWMAEHLQKMKLWSLNPESGLWEEEAVLRPAGGGRRKREERTFLVGNLEIRERRLFNLDVPEDRRCFVKVRAYSNEKFNPYEQLEGVVISLINLEPQPGFPSNPRAWGRFDSVVTGPNGACLPAFCDSRRPDAYTALVSATLGGEELEAVASSPKLNPNAVGVSQPYLGKLGYRRSDHDDPALKKTAFQINVAKPDPNNVDESNGPVYSYRSLRECEEAPVSANHLRFYRVEVDKYEYNVVPFKESDVTSWTGDYLAWWPNPQEFRACFIKVQIEGPQEYMVRSRNVGGSHPRTRGQLYGLRDSRSVRDPLLDNTSGACVEFKCGGMLFDQSLVDRTLVSIIPQGSCRRTAINGLLRDYLSRHPPAFSNARSCWIPLGHNYGWPKVNPPSVRCCIDQHPIRIALLAEMTARAEG
uniref:Cartilage intermediate layer protein 2 n=1 Tax=Malurus cyaneus samueli TaxID=2593467 RepID=A0A8C5UA87_9PASS